MNKQKKNVERVYKYFVRLFSYSTTGCLLCVVALRVVVLSDGDDEVAGCFSLPPPSLLSSSCEFCIQGYRPGFSGWPENSVLIAIATE